MTIDEIAELAYVSRSVVSRVLNDHPNVSDEARERVLQVIEEHDYRPNSMARSLATDQSYEISILTPRRGDESLANGYWPLLYSGIFEQCLERGYFVSLTMVDPDMEDEITDRVGDTRFDGYMLITEEVADIVGGALRERGVPTVLIGDTASDDAFHSIDIDNTGGGYKAGAHLCDLGHGEIGVILGNPQLKETADRRAGFRRALDEADRTVRDRHVATGDYSQENGYNVAKQWSADDAVPSALFCGSDTIAMGVLLAFQEEGYRVPEDVAVVGFDGLPSSKYTIPPLTTVRQPVYEKGQEAANLLIDEIQGGEPSGSASLHKALEAELVVRESCGAHSVDV